MVITLVRKRTFAIELLRKALPKPKLSLTGNCHEIDSSRLFKIKDGEQKFLCDSKLASVL